MDMDSASNLLQRVTKRDSSVTDLIDACEKLTGPEKGELSAKLYKAWLLANADHSLAYTVQYNLGTVLSQIGDLQGAKDAYSAAIALKEDFFPAYINIGSTLERMGATGEAVSHWLTVVRMLGDINSESVSHKLTALNQIGRVLEKTHLETAAEDALRQSIEIEHNPDAIQHWLALRQKQCEWPVIQPIGKTSRQTLFSGMSPHSLVFHTDDPILHLGRAYTYYKRKIGYQNKFFCSPSKEKRNEKRQADNRKIKVGYISSYFREHAHSFLTAEIYKLHDRTKLEIFAYSCSNRTMDYMQKKIMEDVDHWIDINDMTDEEAAERIYKDGIDILIDFNGYTGEARVNICAMRPAPVIVNWLGYPGSMGTPYHNYIIADDFIIPPDLEKYYSEAVVRLPCYQPNDRSRAVSDHRWTRQEAGLPENAMVFCSFNGIQKITSFMWQRYLSILANVPGSVLWLLGSYGPTEQRLKILAAEQGVDPERLIFAPKLANTQHLARYPLADLFLDSAPCGAHTTASDALWMGVPVLTMAGRGFAARVCGSLAKSAGLDQLVCHNIEDYVRKAVELGNNTDKLAELKATLKSNIPTCDLFDTPKLVKHLDDLLVQMHAREMAGETPHPDLINLEIYNDIGTEIDRDDVEMAGIADYEDLYLRRLRDLHDYYPIARDTRLWTTRAKKPRKV
jgi:predicted O-linked N-acetylglucosamine transferase (SPINDLY family)